MTESIHPAAQTGFASSAELYQQVRPSYPKAITTWLTEHLHLKADDYVLDLGAGTGKFLANLTQVSKHVYAAEPIKEMLQQLCLQYPQVHSVQASSQALPFAEQNFDAVLCAQSFHWFADIESLKEIHRVLKPKAALGLIWNQRDERVDWVKALAELVFQYEADTPRFHNQAWKKVFDQSSLFNPIDLQRFDHQQSGRVEDVVSKRLLSTSFIAAMPKQQQQQLKHQFEQIVLDYTGKQPHDHIDFPYTSYAYFYEKI